MKKIIALVLTLICVFAFTSCKSEEEIVLNVFNWGEYLADGDGEWTYVDGDGNEITVPYMDINSEFENYFFDKHGKKLKVNYTTYASVEEMYAKLTTSDASFDIIIPSDYLIPQLIDNNLIQPIDIKNIPNYENLGEKYVVDGLSYREKDGERTYYSATYTFGKVGIIYNKTRLTEMIEDFDEEAFIDEGYGVLWNEKYAPAGILQFNNSRDAFATAQFSLAYKNGNSPESYINGVYPKDEQNYSDALEMLKKQQPLIQKYVMDEVFNKMESGNAAIAPYYVGDFFTMYANSEDELCFFYPKEGSNSFFDAMCVPTSSSHPEIAEEYINFLLSTDEDPAKSVAENNAEYICYANPNINVQQSESYKYFLENEMHEDAYDLLYSEESFNYDVEGYRSLDENTQKHLNELWDSLKIQDEEGEQDIVLPAICIILASAIASWLIFIAVRKRHRAKFYD